MNSENWYREFQKKNWGKINEAIGKKFVAEKTGNSENADESDEDQGQSERSSASIKITDQTGQLVFFPPAFAKEISRLVASLRERNNEVYMAWVYGKNKKQYKKDINEFEETIFEKSKSLTVDIGLFGRMTTSDLVVNVEAACQVAHAISTHETLIESDYFTAIDDKKDEFALKQSEKTGAAFLGSGETVTFFNSAIYYKYLNLDVDALKNHLEWGNDEAAQVAGILVRAAALTNPTGKQNSFAAHGIPELILVEVSEAKLPISYANAFLKPVESIDLMNESALALRNYVDTVASAFVPENMSRVLLAKGTASVDIGRAKRVDTLDELVVSLVELVGGSA